MAKIQLFQKYDGINIAWIFLEPQMALITLIFRQLRIKID